MNRTTGTPTDQSPKALDQLYHQRLNRYLTAMHNKKPDRVPIRPFLAEFCAKNAGYDCMQVTHDIDMAFKAVRQTAQALDCDAMVGNMVYVWTGLTLALGTKYYGIPGIDCPADHGFQYIEPPEEKAWMKPDEYDQLIEDPTGYLQNVWLPRVNKDIVSTGEPVTWRNQMALLKGGMAMLHYFNEFGTQANLMKTEAAMPGAICGILKAPLDILADKLRGYMGLISDLHEQPEKVLAACQALAPHLLHVALGSADPQKQLPIGFWMHRSCVPFITPTHFEQIHWPTLKPIIENLWAAGHQTLFYAEGNWEAHLDAFAQLPSQSIIYHVDQGDIVKVHHKLGHKFCISGGVPNTLFSFGSPDQVRQQCKKIIDSVAADGGYIMDASAIVQNDAKLENIQAMIDFTRDYGVYDGVPSEEIPVPVLPDSRFQPTDISRWHTDRKPGVCVPWAKRQKELPDIERHESMVQRIWEDIDGFGYTFIWHCLVSF